MNHIQFTLEKYRPDWGRWQGVAPVVDGVSLVEMVGDFEKAQGFDVPGSYAGLEPSTDDAEQWVRYLWGERLPEDNETSNGVTWLLGCNCSVAGCWPLEAHVVVDPDYVMWDRFRQPFRPQQDYSAFGPFMFSRSEYEQAISNLLVALGDD